MSEKLTEMAEYWQRDGMPDGRIIDNVTDEVFYDFVDQYDLHLSDRQEAHLTMLIRSIVTDEVDWDKLDENNESAADWDDAKRSAVYR